MMLQRLSKFVLRGCVAGALVGCQDEGGGPTELPPLAFVRYVNFVSDTGALNIRIVDILPEAPATFGALFRTGGSPIAVGAETAPPYQAVAAGTRHIKVFNSDTIAANAQQVHLDTTFTFEANRYYTFALHGFSRTGQTPPLRALITADPTPPTLAANQFAIRVLSFAPSLAGAIPTLADTTTEPDAFLIEEFGIVPSGAAAAAAVTYLDVAQPYVALDTGRYRVALTPTGTTAPVFAQAHVPPGAARTATAGPVPGSLAPGTVLTAVIVPRSVPASRAPQTRPTLRATDTTVAEASQRMFRSNDTVTVQSGSVSLLRNRSPARPDSTVGITGTGVSTGITCSRTITGSLQCPAADVILMTGATEPEYNGWHVVFQVADTLICNPVHANDTQTSCAATNVTATTRFRYRYRIAGAPASPATGAPQYRIYPPSTVADYQIPYVSFLVDKRP
jgi:hypothetical protein